MTSGKKLQPAVKAVAMALFGKSDAPPSTKEKKPNASDNPQPIAPSDRKRQKVLAIQDSPDVKIAKTDLQSREAILRSYGCSSSAGGSTGPCSAALLVTR